MFLLSNADLEAIQKTVHLIGEQLNIDRSISIKMSPCHGVTVYNCGPNIIRIDIKGL